ncbi:MAG: hypothetical protein AAF571_09810 [Verrucomicrobiota bacterium]
MKPLHLVLLLPITCLLLGCSEKSIIEEELIVGHWESESVCISSDPLFTKSVYTETYSADGTFRLVGDTVFSIKGTGEIIMRVHMMESGTWKIRKNKLICRYTSYEILEFTSNDPSITQNTFKAEIEYTMREENRFVYKITSAFPNKITYEWDSGECSAIMRRKESLDGPVIER